MLALFVRDTQVIETNSQFQEKFHHRFAEEGLVSGDRVNATLTARVDPSGQAFVCETHQEFDFIPGTMKRGSGRGSLPTTYRLVGRVPHAGTWRIPVSITVNGTVEMRVTGRPIPV